MASKVARTSAALQLVYLLLFGFFSVHLIPLFFFFFLFCHVRDDVRLFQPSGRPSL